MVLILKMGSVDDGMVVAEGKEPAVGGGEIGRW